MREMGIKIKNPGFVYGSVFLMVEKPLSGFVTIVTLRPYSVKRSFCTQQTANIKVLTRLAQQLILSH